MAKRTHLELAEHHLKKFIADDIYLEVLRLILIRLVERCDDPARLKQLHNIYGLPYDEKFGRRCARLRHAMR